jgi:WD40 repeat protein/uncharacterized caspase-like protein
VTATPSAPSNSQPNLGIATTADATVTAREPALAVELVPQFGHGLNVNGISISPNGKVAATASADKTVRVWDVESGILLRQLSISDQVQDVAILHDGVRAAVIGADDVQLWDLSLGRKLTQFKTEKSPAFRVRLLHRKDAVILSDAAGGVELWDLAQLKQVRKLAAENPNGRHAVYALDVTFDDSTVASASEDGTIQLIDTDSGRVLRTLNTESGIIYAAKFSKAGERLTSFGNDGTIRQWDVKSGREIRSQRFGASIAAAELVTDDLAIVSGYSGSAKFIDLTSGRTLRTLEPWPSVPFDGLKAIAVSPDGRRSVAADRNNSVLFSNLNDGTPIHATAKRRSGPFSLALSPRGDQLALSFGGGEVDIWDAVLGARVRRLTNTGEDYGVSHVAFSPDGRLLLRAADHALSIWDTRSGELLRQTQAPKPFTTWSLAVSPNGQFAAVGGTSHVAVFEIESGRHLWTAEHQMTVNCVAFTADSNQLLAGSENQNTRVYDARTGREALRFNGPRSSLSSIDFFDKNTVLLGGFDVLGLWDLRSGQSSRTYSTFHKGSGVGVFSVDKRWVFGGDEVGMMSVYDAHSGQRLRQFAAHADQIKTIVPSRDGKLVFSTSFDGTIRVTPVETLLGSEPNADPRPMVWLGEHDDWLAYSADGYFDASRRGGSLVAAVRGFDGFRVDQLAVRNNRPDMTLGRIGLGTKEALAFFTSRHQQRLRRLGFEEAELSQNLLSAPSASIVELTRTGRQARLNCTFSGNGRKLKRYFAFVNDVAVGDGEGKPLTGTETTRTFEVELSSGRNKVEISVINDLGIESFRDVRTINVTEPVRGNLYYLGFGVSRYNDSRLTLKYAHKDALDLGRTLEQMQNRGFDRVFSRVLTDSQVTKSNVAAAREFLLPAKVDDTIVVFVAGHGIFDSGPNEQYYFVTYDADISRIHETAAGFGLIEDLVTGIAPRKKLLLLDTCQSGERDSDEEVVRVSAGRSRGLVARGIRPIVLDSGKPASHRPRFLGSQDRFIFNDLSRRSGTIVFSASRGSELSYEDDRLQNGMFTYELVRALASSSADTDRDGFVSTDELRANVTQAVLTRTYGLQNPTVDRDNLEALFGFPVAGGVARQPNRTEVLTSPAPVAHPTSSTTFTTTVRTGEVTTIVVPTSRSSAAPPQTQNIPESRKNSALQPKPPSVHFPSKATESTPSASQPALPKGTVRRIPGQKRTRR